jgi:signal transduction histidine kinase
LGHETCWKQTQQEKTNLKLRAKTISDHVLLCNLLITQDDEHMSTGGNFFRTELLNLWDVPFIFLTGFPGECGASLNASKTSVTRKWVLIALILTAAAGDLVAATVSPPGFWSQFLPNLYYAAIVIAGLEYGWKIGLGFAIASAVSHAIIDTLFVTRDLLPLRAPAVAFLIVGFAFFERRRSAEKNRAEPGQTPLRPDGRESVEQVAEIASELLREVRTPVASIEGAAYILEESGPDLENQKEFVEIIRCECQRLNRILAEVEECTEVIPLRRAVTDAATLLGEVVRLSALGHPDPAISLKIEVAPDLPPLWCDQQRVEQSLVPFVTSAMSGMSAGGQILLAARREGDQARIQIRVLDQTIQAADPLVGRGQYSSTFEASSGVRVLAARRTILQHGGTIAVEQSGHMKRLSSLTLPLYNKQAA